MGGSFSDQAVDLHSLWGEYKGRHKFRILILRISDQRFPFWVSVIGVSVHGTRNVAWCIQIPVLRHAARITAALKRCRCVPQAQHVGPHCSAIHQTQRIRAGPRELCPSHCPPQNPRYLRKSA